MNQELIELLKQSEASDWSVTEKKTEAWEFYFIGHRLDQNRIRNVIHTDVTVYRKLEDGAFLGSASCEIPQGIKKEEMKKTIDALLYQATLVKNPYYTLVQPSEIEPITQNIPDVQTIAHDFLDAMNELPETETETVNSYEIFVENNEVNLVTSTGIDITSVYPSSMLDVVVNARREKHEIELYRLYHSGSCDKEMLKQNLSETLRFGKDRLNAKKTPNLGKASVILSTDAALAVYNYFIDRMNSSAKYQGISDWEIGKEVVDGYEGDSLTISSVRYLENSSKNFVCDREGAVIRDCKIIENGIAREFWGPRQFNAYLNIENGFLAQNFVVEPGVRSSAELRQGEYIEVVEFSDFQISSLDGMIAGEIRLGYYHKDGEVIPVTGGSVSGSMVECAKYLNFSKELRQYDTYLIPSITKLNQATVTGAE